MKMAGIFSDGMILQRDKENHIWGYDDGIAEVTLELEQNTYKGKVVDGRFDILIPPMGIRRDMSITVRGSETITITDVCFGDLFLMSGQSNMELPVSRTLDETQPEVNGSNYPYIRQYRLTPQKDLIADESYRLPDLPWVRAVGNGLMEMSAYAFFCFKHLYDEFEVPVGIVLNAQGGSTIEAFMPYDALCDEDRSIADTFYGEGVLSSYLKGEEERLISWRTALEKPDDRITALNIPSDPLKINIPGMLREANGYDITGSVWLYKTFEVKASDITPDAFLYMGMLIDADRTYINGINIGRTEYKYPPRKYPFDGSILKEGENIIAIRLITEGDVGGAVPFHPYYIRVGEKVTDLTGEWNMSYESHSEAFVPGRMFVEIPSLLYKASVRTLKGLKFKAMFWYQGESNASRPEGYDGKLKQMTDIWRETLSDDLPVIVTVMPDYTDPQSDETAEVSPGWKEIQRMQRTADGYIKNCRIVDGTDLGSKFELHPQRKSELGSRAYEVLRKFLY